MRVSIHPHETLLSSAPPCATLAAPRRAQVACSDGEEEKAEKELRANEVGVAARWVKALPLRSRKFIQTQVDAVSEWTGE